ncbi:DUF4232 domain-containing protein [Streptomyces paludis]|uniref:DUF4232 domain-containing protein n=1 Tax=Streptomyces paludis TaxID=2282738 RepID=A0A345HZG5_9ACTN|nr:DUF4232 domain-containing protein [Streptomyces paludis]AXG82089.1 DUF4232 domain-containing protein [Streptomyces paludis]
MSDHFESVRAGRARRAGALAVAAGLLALATAACGSGSGGQTATGGGGGTAGDASSGAASSGGASSGGAPSPAPSSSAAPAGTAASTAAGTAPSGTAGSAAPAPAAAPRCTAERLGLNLSAPDVGAGNIRYDLRLVNKGTSACTLQGFPGVSLLAGDGEPIGRPATQEGERLPAVTLAPGGVALTTLHTLNKGIKGPSCWQAPSLIRIYPPGSTDAMTLRSAEPVVCGDTFTVTAMSAG